MSDIAEGDDTALNLSLSPQSEGIPAETDNGSLKEEVDISAGSDADNDYYAMTVAELRSLAKNKGLTGYSTMNKAELIALLSES